MVDRNDTAEGMLTYLQRSRALSATAKQGLCTLVQLVRENTSLDPGKVGLSTIDRDAAYVYLYSKEGAHFQLLYRSNTGLTVQYAPPELNMLTAEFLLAWERATVEESSDALVAQLTHGLNRVIAFQQGKAYEISMREVGEFDAEFYVRQHVEQQVNKMRSAYQATLDSLQSNLSTQKARYDSQISELQQQTLGSIDIDWKRVAQGRFFPYRLPGTNHMGLAAVIPVAIKRVRWGEGDDNQVFLTSPIHLPDAVVFKIQSGKWHLFDRDGDPYPHPHVLEGRDVGSDYGHMCVGDADDCLDRLTSSSKFEMQLPRIREVVGGINWGSSFRNPEEFAEIEPGNIEYKPGYEAFQVFSYLEDEGTMEDHDIAWSKTEKSPKIVSLE